MMPALAVATAHTFVLTVSHGLLFRQPLFTAAALLSLLLFRIRLIWSRVAASLEIVRFNLCLDSGPDPSPNKGPNSGPNPAQELGKLHLHLQFYSRCSKIPGSARQLRAPRTHESITI